jgi:hypothetical protein
MAMLQQLLRGALSIGKRRFSFENIKSPVSGPPF